MEKEKQEIEERFIRVVKAKEEESQGLAEDLIRAAKAGVKFTEMEPVPLKSAEPEREI